MGLIIFESFVAITIVAVWAWLITLVFDAFPDFPYQHKQKEEIEINPDWPFPRGPKP